MHHAHLEFFDRLGRILQIFLQVSILLTVFFFWILGCLASAESFLRNFSSLDFHVGRIDHKSDESETSALP